MKKFIVSAFTFLSLVLCVTNSSAGCLKRPNPRVLIAGWDKSDKAFLKGRRVLYVYFNRYPNQYHFYTDDGDYYRFRAIASTQRSINTAYRKMRRLSRYINLKFRKTSSPKRADIRVYVSCERDISEYGFVGTNSRKTQAIIALNQCTSSSISRRNILSSYGFLHELGHALGLKHPFDNSTGYCLYSTRPYSRYAATTSQTLMAYKHSPYSPIPKWYTKLDIQALRMIWGRPK